MRSEAWPLVAAAGLALILGAAGCGGDDAPATRETGGGSQTPHSSSSSSTTRTTGGGGKGGDALHAEYAIKAVFTAGDCREFVTHRYVTAAYGSVGACTAAVNAGGLAKDLEIRSLDLDGDHAVARIVPQGGPSAGETLTVQLVRDGDWNVDSVESKAPVGP